MTNHPGDHHSFLQLAQLREEDLERKSKQRSMVIGAGYHTGAVRPAIARFLRSVADRLEPKRTSEDRQPRPRYQRAP